jgi:hypothetical protein
MKVEIDETEYSELVNKAKAYDHYLECVDKGDIVVIKREELIKLKENLLETEKFMRKVKSIFGDE